MRNTQRCASGSLTGANVARGQGRLPIFKPWRCFHTDSRPLLCKNRGAIKLKSHSPSRTPVRGASGGSIREPASDVVHQTCSLAGRYSPEAIRHAFVNNSNPRATRPRGLPKLSSEITGTLLGRSALQLAIHHGLVLVVFTC